MKLSVEFDFCIGADGSYSIIRRQMMRVVKCALQLCIHTGPLLIPASSHIRMDYHQEYIRDEYIELKMPAGRDSDGQPTFLLDPNHLHIWPRHSFMLIALPNKVNIFNDPVSNFSHIQQDKTFTCTLFAPSFDLDRLNNADDILTWFRFYFPDALRIIGEKTLVNDFTRNPRSSLIVTKVM